MAQKAGLIGMELVNANLNKRLGVLTKRGIQGMYRSIILIRKSMETTPPLVPIDTGNLRASWFQEFFENAAKGQVGIAFGFNSNYAVYVHEMGGSDINWSRPGSGPKFLQAAVRRNSKEIVKIIALSMKTGE